MAVGKFDLSPAKVPSMYTLELSVIEAGYPCEDLRPLVFSSVLLEPSLFRMELLPAETCESVILSPFPPINFSVCSLAAMPIESLLVTTNSGSGIQIDLRYISLLD